MPCRIPARELREDVAAHRARAEHGEDLERDDRGVRGAPPEVGGGVFAPCMLAPNGDPGLKFARHENERRERNGVYPGENGASD